MGLSRLFLLCLTLIAWSATASAADRPAEGPAGPTADAQIVEGFRSAHFGMDEKQVRAAIAKDFGHLQPRLLPNPSQRTQALVVTGATVQTGAPPATISYILGMSSANLIQVNVVWGDEPGGTDIATLRPMYDILRAYFIDKAANKAYVRESVAVDQPLPNGGMLGFKGADIKGSEIRLEWYEVPRQKGSKPPPPAKAKLRLSYVDDPANPDIFRIRAGSF